MKPSTVLSLVVLALALFGSSAVPVEHRIARPRIGGTTTTATALHAVLVVVIRDDHDENQGAFGGGAIVTRNRVITAAHVVVDAVEVQVGFYVNSVQASNFRRADPNFVQIFDGFDPVTLHRDIAVLQFRGTPFLASNVIALTNTPTPIGDALLVSYGFNSATATRPSTIPLLAAHTIAECDEDLAATETHFCALAVESFVCPGDNGSGLYTEGAVGVPSALIGLVSTIYETCLEAAQSAFTDLADPDIRLFLESQGIPVEEMATAAA